MSGQLLYERMKVKRLQKVMLTCIKTEIEPTIETAQTLMISA